MEDPANVPDAPNALLVLTTLPDAESAQAVARRLIELRLAACVNIMAPCQSIYRWQGAVEAATEVPLVIKTQYACYPALEAALRQHHPYTLPEIVALPVVTGLPDYLAWVAAETTPETSSTSC